jgi:hypothetical protein
VEATHHRRCVRLGSYFEFKKAEHAGKFVFLQICLNGRWKNARASTSKQVNDRHRGPNKGKEAKKKKREKVKSAPHFDH